MLQVRGQPELQPYLNNNDDNNKKQQQQEKQVGSYFSHSKIKRVDGENWKLSWTLPSFLSQIGTGAIFRFSFAFACV